MPIEPFSRDTSPEAQELLVARWRAMSSAEKARVVQMLTRDSTALARAGIHDTHPAASPEQIRFLLAVRRFGRELASRAFGSSSSEY